LIATLLEKEPLRFTPAGIAVFEGKFRHDGQVYEAGAMRRLEFGFPAVAFADAAVRLNQVNPPQQLAIVGFLAPKSMKTQKLVVHITEFTIRS
jgi:putative primosomal replication protein N, priB